MGHFNNYTTEDLAKLTEINDSIARDLIPAMVFIGLLMIMGIVGNLVVCYIFYFRLRMNTQHFLIIGLAVFDLLSCFIGMPTEISDMRYFYTFDSEFACRLLRFNNYFCAFASILTLVVIAVDRYQKICRPFKRQMSLQRAKVALLVVLVVALLFAIPAPILNGIRTAVTSDPDVYGHDCATDDSVKDTVYPLIYSSVLFLSFIILLVALTVIYVRIWREMKRHNRYMARNSDAKINQRYPASTSDVSSASEFTEDCNRQLPVPHSGKAAVGNANDEPARARSLGKCDVGGQRDEPEFAGSGDGENHHCSSVQSDITYCETEQDQIQGCETEQDQIQGVPGTGQRVQDAVDEEQKMHGVSGSEQGRLQDVGEMSTCVEDVFGHEMSVQNVFCANQLVQRCHDAEPSVQGVYDAEQSVQGVYDAEQSVQDVFSTEQNIRGVYGKELSAQSQSGEHAIFESTIDCTLDKDCCTFKSSFTKSNNVCTPEKLMETTSVFTVEGTHGCDMEDRKTRNDNVDCDKTSSSDTLPTLTVSGSDSKHDEHVTGSAYENQPRFSPQENEKQKNAECFHSGNSRVDAEVDRSGEGDPIAHNEHPHHGNETGTATSCTEKSEAPTSPHKSPRKPSVTFTNHNGATVSNKPPSLFEAANGSETGTESGCTAESEVTKTLHESPSKTSVSVTSDHLGTTATDKPLSCSQAERGNPVARREWRKGKAAIKRLKSQKATRIAMSVTLVFFLSFLPHLSLITARLVHTDFDRSLRGAALVMYNIFLRSYFINSVANPIIYGVQNVRFRAECYRLFREIVSCRRHRPVISES